LPIAASRAPREIVAASKRAGAIGPEGADGGAVHDRLAKAARPTASQLVLMWSKRRKSTDMNSHLQSLSHRRITMR